MRIRKSAPITPEQATMNAIRECLGLDWLYDRSAQPKTDFERFAYNPSELPFGRPIRAPRAL